MKNQTQYLLVGSGHVSRHFQKYLSLLQLSFSSWDRSQSIVFLKEKIPSATHILLLMSDSAIENFYHEHLLHSQKIIVHFSGALEIEGVVSAHPLMTFSKNLYSLEDYQKIPFVLTSDLPFCELLPGLPNAHYKIQAEDKPIYHALCVLSGNFTTLLWQKMNSGLKSLGLPGEIFYPYLRQTTFNILQDNENALTGPFARRDLKTVLANDQALARDPFRMIYRAFIQVYFPEALKELKNEDS